MVKTLFVFFACAAILTIGVCCAAFSERTMEFYSGLPREGVNFYQKLQYCIPSKYEPTMETIYGVTKDGRCHYSYKEYVRGDLTEFHCIMPMQVAIGYATTSLDVNEYSGYNIGLAAERLLQNNEIRKIMLDYCKRKV